MLKHPEITERRIAQFVNGLEGKWYAHSLPVKVEFCEEPHQDQNAATRGPWQPVADGFRWGPAWRTVWFRLSAEIPAAWERREVVLRAELGGERTVWADNVPVQGLDEFHKYYAIAKSARPGKFEVLIQAYGNNPDVRVHGVPQNPQPLPFTIEIADICLFDREQWQLWLDCKFGYELAVSLPEGTPERAHLIRALNEAANLYGHASTPDIKRIIKTALEAGSANSIHTLTPVGHGHLDTAWLWPLHITMKKMAHTSATQLALMNEYPEYIYVHSQGAQYEWLEKQYPELFTRIQKRIKSGQWEPLGSMWVEADTNLAGGESLVRQVLYGKKYFKEKFGIETKDMWLPDVFGYSAAIPQILQKCNIDSFLTQKISWNQFNKFPHNTFWWQGIDGSKIWTHFPPADTYIGQGTPLELRKHLTQHRDPARSDQALYVFGWGDGGGGPTPQHLEFLRRASKAPGLPKIKWQRAAEFFQEAQKSSNDLQTWVGELYFELHRGTYTTQANNKKHNRKCEFLLRDAEYLCAWAASLGAAYPAKELEELWKVVLLNQFHDILPGSSVREVYEDSDIDYAHVYTQAQSLVDNALGHVAVSDGKESAYAIFHFAETQSEGRLPKQKAKSLVCGNEITPLQEVDEWGEKSLLFRVPETALSGVAIASLSQENAPQLPRPVAKSRRLESDTWSVKFDSNGNITSIISLEDQTEYIEQGKLANLFQLFDDKPLFWSAWDVDIFALETQQDLVKSERFEIAETGPLRVAMEIEKRIGESTLKQRISLGPTPGIRFDTWVDWRETDKMLKVAFPVNVNAARATYEIQYGNVERPTHMNTSWDIARFEVCAHKWVDLSEGDHGVALLNDCKYGHDIQGNVMRLTLLRSPKAPDPVADMGIHRFTYVLLPHFGPYNWANVVQSAYALNAKVHAVPIKSGVQAAHEPFAVCEDRNVVIESVKQAESGKGIIVRLYEAHNARGNAELAMAMPIKKAFICDMLENERDQLTLDGNRIQFSYKPFEIITIKVT